MQLFVLLVEGVFSRMNDINSKICNSMRDRLLIDSLVTFSEKDIFLNISLDAIVE